MTSMSLRTQNCRTRSGPKSFQDVCAAVRCSFMCTPSVWSLSSSHPNRQPRRPTPLSVTPRTVGERRRTPAPVSACVRVCRGWWCVRAARGARGQRSLGTIGRIAPEDVHQQQIVGGRAVVRDRQRPARPTRGQPNSRQRPARPSQAAAHSVKRTPPHHGRRAARLCSARIWSMSTSPAPRPPCRHRIRPATRAASGCTAPPPDRTAAREGPRRPSPAHP